MQISSCPNTDGVHAAPVSAQPEGYLRAVLEVTPACVKVVAPDGRIRYINPAGLGLFEAEAEADVIGRHVLDFISPEYRPQYARMHARACQGQRESLEFEYLGLRGSRRYVRTVATPFIEADGTVSHLAVTHDLTELRRAEIAQHESEQRFRTTADSAPVLMWMSRPDGQRSWFNKPWLDFVGRTMEQQVALGWMEGVHPDDLSRCRGVHSESLECRRPFETEYRIRRQDGEYRWMLEHGVPLFAPDGAFTGFIGTCIDLSDRKRAELEREASLVRERSARAETQVLYEVSNLLSGELDLRKLLQCVTDAGTALTGANFGVFCDVRDDSGECGVIQSITGTDQEAIRPLVAALVGRACLKRETIRSDDAAHDPRVTDVPGLYNGPIRSLLAVPVISRAREVLGVLLFGHGDASVFSDRSERFATGLAAQAAIAIDNARLYQARLESEQRFQTVADTLPAMVWAADAGGSFFYVNRRWSDYTGLSLDQVAGEGWSHAIYEEDREQVVSTWRDALRSGEAFECECRYVASDGSYRWHYVRGVPLRDEQNAISAWYGTSVDIHDRRAAEEARHESEQRLRTLADNMAQLAWMADASGAVFWFNRRWYDFTGTTFAQVQGWSWASVQHPEHGDEVMRRIRTHCSAGEPWEETFPLRGKDGSYRWFLTRAVPIRNAEGRLARWFGTGTDITERRELEQELARAKADLERRVEERSRELTATYDRLRLAERMAMMGTLSAGLGHDLGNLLVPIRVRLDSLTNEPLSPRAKEDVLAVQNSAEYLRRLAQGLRLLALDPRQVHADDTTELGEWWTDAHGVLKSVLPRGVTLTARIPARKHYVRMSKPALTQVVFNLVQNAGDALQGLGSGHVEVRVHREQHEVLLSVADNGPGMSTEVREHCMEPFFTTKPRAGSSGLGLVLVHGLVRDAGGTVELTSSPGRETVFTLHLPVAEPPREAACSEKRYAIVDVRDGRLKSFMAGELRSLRFEVGQQPNGVPPLVVVVDDESRLDQLPGDAAVVFLGETGRSAHNIRVLGRNPSVMKICQALRDAARAAEEKEVRVRG